MQVGGEGREVWHRKCETQVWDAGGKVLCEVQVRLFLPCALPCHVKDHSAWTHISPAPRPPPHRCPSFPSLLQNLALHVPVPPFIRIPACAHLATDTLIRVPP